MKTFDSVSIITQTFPPRVGGMEAVMSCLAEEFSRAGKTVRVFPDKAAPYAELFEVYRLPAPKIVRGQIKKFLVGLHGQTSDLVICDSWKSVSAVPSRFKNVVVLAHGQEYLATDRRLPRIIRALERACAIVCSSNATKALIEDMSLKYRNKTYVVYPTYMLKTVPKISPRRSSDSKIRVATVCRLEARKGILNSIKAASKVREQGFDFCWRIGGTGPQYGELSTLIKELNLNDCIELVGRLDETEKRNLLDSSDLYLMPSYMDRHSLEGFGISYVEASAFAVPSIGGKVGGAPEAVGPADCGWCCDGSNVNEIFAALLAAVKDKKRLLEKGANARARFEEHLIGSESFKKLLEICDASYSTKS